MAEASRKQYFNARLKDIEKIKINMDDHSIRGLLISNENKKFHSQIINEIHDAHRNKTKSTLAAIRNAGLID